MARRTLRRTWRRTKNGSWTCSLGERGMRIRLFQKRSEGMFYRAVWKRGEGRDQAPLHTRDRDEAEKRGRALLAELLRGASPVHEGPFALGELSRRFQLECAAFLDNKERTRRDSVARIEILQAYFGRNRDVRTLSALDQSKYTAARLHGGVQLLDGRATQPVRARSVDADLYVLHQMLAWAVTVPNGSGRLLDRNPLAGVRREREKNPRRPVATWERFQATRDAIVRLRLRAKTESEGRRWSLIELALVLAEATGRRLSAIRQLRWDDIDEQRGTIRWRAETDKKGIEWVIPAPASLLDELHNFREDLPSSSPLVFPAEKSPTKSMDRHLFKHWLVVAEREAGLEKLEGALWHAYRRKWASERKHHPLVDVAAAGGWKDHATLLECYQAPDQVTLLAVMSEPVKRRDVGPQHQGAHLRLVS